jgi:DNA helicase-2/ATP-dependent DNA helicase PcrA
LDEIDFQHIDLSNLRGGRQPGPLVEMIQLSGRLHDELRTLEDLQSYLELAPDDDDSDELRDYARALEVYARRKRALGAIDYGDQIGLACELLSRPDVAAIYWQRYRYILVDEYQDTNFSQSVLVRLLAGDLRANVCVVGDPNQAIYGFRGAAPDNIDRFAQSEFPEARTVVLAENFRSTQPILDVANAIWEQDPGEFRGNLVASDPSPAPRPALVTCQAEEDEIAYIAAQIALLAAERVDAGAEPDRVYRDFAVIARKNAMKRRLWAGLRERGIPAEMVGGISQFETPEVRELVSCLRAIAHPADDPSLAHVLASERWGVDERGLYEVARLREPRESLNATVRRLAAKGLGPDQLPAFVRQLDRLIAASYRVGLNRLVEAAIAVRQGAYDPVELASIQRFQALARAFAASRIERPGLAEFLAYLDLLLLAGPEDDLSGETELGENNTVKVMTAHASKGLEWPVVFVAGANKNDFVAQSRGDVLPAALSHRASDRPVRSAFPNDVVGDKAFGSADAAWRKAAAAQEERRTLYVALTRARERLYLTWSLTTPSRLRETQLLPALEPAVEFCEQVVAPPAPDTGWEGRSLREVAPAVMVAGRPLLASAPEERQALVDALAGPWIDVGGDPEVLAPAVDRFYRERSALEELVAAIDAHERRQAMPEVLSGERFVTTYSQLDSFASCPHRYYLAHKLGLPGLPRAAAQEIGTAFHEAVATEARRRVAGLPVTPGELRGWFRPRAQSPHQSSEASGETPAAGMNDPIAAYLASPEATAEPLLVEEPFSVAVGDAVVRGVIDRIQRAEDGEVEVVDFKTERRPRTGNEVREGWQLPIYLLGCREAFPEIQPPPARAVMLFVRANERVVVTYTPEELEATRQEIARAIGRMQAVTVEEHRASPATCAACDYHLTCRHAIRETLVV